MTHTPGPGNTEHLPMAVRFGVVPRHVFQRVALFTCLLCRVGMTTRSSQTPGPWGTQCRHPRTRAGSVRASSEGIPPNLPPVAPALGTALCCPAGPLRPSRAQGTGCSRTQFPQQRFTEHGSGSGRTCTHRALPVATLTNSHPKNCHWAHGSPRTWLAPDSLQSAQ